MRIKTLNQNNIDRQGYIYILPSFLLIVILLVYPLVNGFYLSLFRTNLINIMKFKGLKNYLEVLTNYGFYNSLIITVKFTLFVVIGHFLIGFLLSNLLNRDLKFTTLFRAVLIIPWLIPESIIAMIFKWLFNPLYGLINHILFSLYVIDEPVSWLGNGDSAFWVVVFVCIWKGYPMVMMMMLTGLQSVPKELYEAAKIDGGGALKCFWYITLPSMKGILNTALVLDTVWWFKHYTIAWVLTQGGPGNATSLISIDVYKKSFQYFQFGKASALAVIIFLFCFSIGKIMEGMLNKNEKH